MNNSKNLGALSIGSVAQRDAAAIYTSALAALLGGAVAAAMVTQANVAYAQSSAPATAQAAPGSQPPSPRQEQDTRPAAAREAENYDPLGIRLGSFKLFPLIEADEVINDNIYATSTATGKTASFVQVFKPLLDLRSDWNNHMLNVFARGAFGIYTADSNLNYQDFSVGADGRLDIQRNWNVYSGVSFSRGHEELGTPNTVTGQFLQTIYNQLAANVGYYQKFGRFSGRLDGRLDNFSYLNNGASLGQGVIPNTDRNRTEFRESARFGYEFIPGYEIWTRGGLNQRRYNTGFDSLGFDRNSSGWDVVGGIAIDFGGITSVEAFAGYLQQNFEDVRFQTIQAATFGLTGYWNPMRELWVKPFVRRTVDDSALSTSASYLSTAFGVDVNYNLRPNIRLDAHGDYSIADYQAVSTANTRYDQYYTARIGLMYLPTRNFFVGPTYQFVHRTSNQFNSDYNQNLIMLRLGARL